MEVSKQLELNVKSLLQAQELNKEKYNAYSKRAALILELYPEIKKLDFKEVPQSVINELNCVNLLAILLEPYVIDKLEISDVSYTNDKCLVKKEKVECYNKYLKQYLYLVGVNLKHGYILLDEDINYTWNILSVEEIEAYYKAVTSINSLDEAQNLMCQIELLRHTQPNDISIRLAELRNIVQNKCRFFQSDNIEVTTVNNDFNNIFLYGTANIIDGFLKSRKKEIQLIKEKLKQINILARIKKEKKS